MLNFKLRASAGSLVALSLVTAASHDMIFPPSIQSPSDDNDDKHPLFAACEARSTILPLPRKSLSAPCWIRLGVILRFGGGRLAKIQAILLLT